MSKDKNFVNTEYNITKRDFRKVFWRSFTLLGSYNFERMEALGFDYSMMPVLKKIYGDDKQRLAEALRRHMEAFNMTVAPSTFVMGISIAMEEKYEKDPSFDVNSINAIKLALMGPLSGIGDTFFWGIFRILAAAIGVSFALKGNIIAPFVFLIMFNVPHFLVTYCAGIVGITAVGCMIATQIAVSSPLQFTISGNKIVIQEYLDQIMPQLLPLIATLVVYYCLKKKVKVGYIMAGIIIIGFICGVLGILA